MECSLVVTKGCTSHMSTDCCKMYGSLDCPLTYHKRKSVGHFEYLVSCEQKVECPTRPVEDESNVGCPPFCNALSSDVLEKAGLDLLERQTVLDAYMKGGKESKKDVFAAFDSFDVRSACGKCSCGKSDCKSQREKNCVRRMCRACCRAYERLDDYGTCYVHLTAIEKSEYQSKFFIEFGFNCFTDVSLY